FETEDPTQAQLTEEWSGNITVDASENNSEDVVVEVTVEDNAGNENSAGVTLEIDSTAPTVSVSMTDNGINSEYAREGYYNVTRTVEITVVDRSDVFDADNATDGITITATDVNGDDVDLSSDEDMISGWTASDEDSSVHTATISFTTDANYEWSIEYTDKAGMSCSADKDSGSSDDSGDNIYSFTLDRTDPMGSVTVLEETWSRLLTKLTFGLCSKVTADVTAESSDDTSPCTVEYYKTSYPLAYSEDDMDGFYTEGEFSDYSDFSISSDEQFVIYLRITDYAGNYIYVSSDGCIVDMTASEITITPSAPVSDNGDEDVYGYYNGDVDVVIDVEEADSDYSGINLIQYWITDGTEDGDAEPDKTTLYEFTESPEEITRDMLMRSRSLTVTVDSSVYDTCDVEVHVYTIDNAGNENTQTITLDIDVTSPAIEISYDNNTARNDTYFNAMRTATVTVTERTHHFDADAATYGIVISAVDAYGSEVDSAYTVNDWTTEEGDTPDEDTHTATISYNKDANYTVAASYTDKAENKAADPDTGDSVAPYSFTVDTTAPTGTVTASGSKGDMVWSRLLSKLTFGFFSNKNIKVTSTQGDATSPIESVKYYKTTSSAAMTAAQLAKQSGWADFKGLTLKTDQQAVVYFKITDMAGNVTYISTDGMIADDTAPTESADPQITVSPQQPVNGFYDGNVKVAISVKDPTAGDTFAGLKEIRYEVTNMGSITQAGTLYSFTNTSPSISDLKQSWSGNITVDASLNNSNNVKITVYADDNAGNTSQASASIKIDVTAPAISVSYNNNSPDSGSYYRSSRTATVTVTERNFDADAVTVNITNSDGSVPKISGWTTVSGSGNGDSTKHVATITYSADGDYTFAIACTDRAGNRNLAVTYAAGTANATEFTIDRTLPAITVSYDNNSSAGDRYFNAARTATITVREHNFDVSRVTFTRTASLDGSQIAAPSVSWSNSGDVHTATIAYTADGDYSFDVSMTDMAGNASGQVSYGDSVAACDFTIDLTIGKPLITGVENGASYKGDVIPGIDFSDVNLDSYEITLLRTRRDEIDVDVTDQFITEITTNGHGGAGEFNTFEKIQDNDGIYTLTVAVRDKAGNEESEAVIFTVNRFGSVYVFNQALLDLEDSYVQAVNNELVITEYNPDRLLEGSLMIEVTKDGAPAADVAYEVSPEINKYVSVAASGWYQYEYTLDTANFSEDGIYSIIVSSEDEAGNLPETTNYEDCEVLFRVDTTPAELSNAAGLEGAIVNAGSVDVEFELFDAIGLRTATICLDGEAYRTYSGEDIEGLTGYSGSFTIDAAGHAQSVRFVVEDMAGNILDTDAQDESGNYLFVPGFGFNRSITVSTNALVRWFANKPLFIGTIVAAAVAVCLIIFLILFMKRKKTGKRRFK
ncbi:MAG: hypothetical protein LUC41_01885, partial [Clostridiales bacterium]|nr:hypothetical protein [Clostridiales bacterium]